ncbi:MAG: porin family protein [Deltaproteobacteria bacterium]|nr:MAG: porin family protein [Deltaproteobacteria bacterium]
MKKLITIAAALVLCLSVSARAESSRRSTSVSGSHADKLLLGIDGSFGLPIGNYADVNGVGGGVLLTAEYPIIEQLAATARIGFNYQLDKSPVAGTDVHVHSVPVLLGAKYYLMPDHQGIFGAAEIGMFDLMSSVSSGGASGSSNDVKFGGGIGLGWQMKQWNARVNLHSHDFGNFGDLMMVSAGVGYQFAGLF